MKNYIAQGDWASTKVIISGSHNELCELWAVVSGGQHLYEFEPFEGRISTFTGVVDFQEFAQDMQERGITVEPMKLPEKWRRSGHRAGAGFFSDIAATVHF